MNNTDFFISQITFWLKRQSEDVAPHIFDEARRLVRLGEYQSAIIAVIKIFESHLRNNVFSDITDSAKHRPLKILVELATKRGKLSAKDETFILDSLKLRNTIVHVSDTTITPQQATKIVNRFYSIIESTNNK